MSFGNQGGENKFGETNQWTKSLYKERDGQMSKLGSFLASSKVNWNSNMSQTKNGFGTTDPNLIYTTFNQSSLKKDGSTKNKRKSEQPDINSSSNKVSLLSSDGLFHGNHRL
jgi:hypothetical protein